MAVLYCSQMRDRNGASVPVDGGSAGLLSTQLGVAVMRRVLVVVTELGLCQERAQLLRLVRAHSQVTVMQVVLHVHEENVSGGEKRQHSKGQNGTLLLR